MTKVSLLTVQGNNLVGGKNSSEISLVAIQACFSMKISLIQQQIYNRTLMKKVYNIAITISIDN